MTTSDTADGPSSELSAAIEALRDAGRHPPRALADAVLRFGAAAVAPLCEVLSDPEVWEPTALPETMFPVHLLYLLGCLGDATAAPTIVEVLRTQDLGDHLTEGVAPVLGALGPAALPSLVPVALDHAVDPWVRNAMGRGLYLAGCAHPEVRAEVAVVLTRMIREADFKNPDDFMTAEMIADDAVRTGDPEAIAAVRDAFARGLGEGVFTDEGMIDRVGAEEPWHPRAHDEPPIVHFEWLERHPPRPTARTLGSVAAPSPVRVAPKVGRNEPCPCGSGKKFKKCCAR